MNEHYNFFYFFFITISVSFVPILVLTFLSEKWMRKTLELKAKKISDAVQRFKDVTTDIFIHFVSDIVKESFKIPIDHFICIVSEANYVHIYFLNNGELTSQ